jgi:hypothetical protein
VEVYEMRMRFVPLLILSMIAAACSQSALVPVELEGLTLYQFDGGGNIRGRSDWTTWASKDGTAWIQRVAITRDLKPSESDEAWRIRGGKWRSTETRWQLQLPEGWWADAVRLVGKHSFFNQSEKNPELPSSKKALAGFDTTTIVAIGRGGTRRKVSKLEIDPAPDFDPLRDHLRSLRNQVESVKPDYDGEADKDWQPPGFPSSQDNSQK